MQNICLYQYILPEVVSEQPIDFPGLLGLFLLQNKNIRGLRYKRQLSLKLLFILLKILEGIRNISDSDSSETAILLQLYVMKCISTADIKHLSWMKEVSYIYK